MQYWLMKSEPDVWSIDQQKKAGTKGAPWDGVRNYQAAKNLKSMKKGDLCFFYHSNIGKEIVGVVKIIKESFGVTEDYPTEILDRTSRDIDSIYGDYGKINKDFGWEPTIELESGIKAMVSWLKNGDLNE